MTTTVADQRLLIPDPVQFDRVSASGDGYSVDFELANAPAVTGSIKVWLNGVLQTLTTQYTVSESMGLVTFVAAPGAGLAVVITYQHSILSDAQIAAAMTLEGDDPRLALAQCLEIEASSEAMIQKRIRVLDISTDGPAVAKELRERAKALREQVASGAVGDALPWAVAEQIVDNFGARERVYKQVERGSA
jgi:hypothetical protein